MIFVKGIGFLVYGVISLTHQFRFLFVSFVSLWFLLLIARFFTKKLYPRVQFIHKTQESQGIFSISLCPRKNLWNGHFYGTS
jgi:hypothetical protein